MDKIISDNGLSGVLRIGATSSDLEKITSFYNTHFIKSQQKLKYKQKMYANTKRSPIILVIKDKNSEIIGLLESWNDKDNPSIKVLATILVSNEYRGHGYARRLFEEALNIMGQDTTLEEMVVHFRDSNKTTLVPIYEHLGFGNLHNVGIYKKKAETKWEMTFSLNQYSPINTD